MADDSKFIKIFNEVCEVLIYVGFKGLANTANALSRVGDLYAKNYQKKINALNRYDGLQEKISDLKNSNEILHKIFFERCVPYTGVNQKTCPDCVKDKGVFLDARYGKCQNSKCLFHRSNNKFWDNCFELENQKLELDALKRSYFIVRTADRFKRK